MVYGALSGLIFLNIQLQWNMECDSRLFWIRKYVTQGWMCILRDLSNSVQLREQPGDSTRQHEAWLRASAVMGGGGASERCGTSKETIILFEPLCLGENTMLRIRFFFFPPSEHCECVRYDQCCVLLDLTARRVSQRSFLLHDDSIAPLCLTAWILAHCIWRRPSCHVWSIPTQLIYLE